MSEDREAAQLLEAAIGYRFHDAELARTCLTHPSHAHEVDGTRGNERLEFLGDSVLDLVIARVLFEHHPDWAEGKLTRVRSSLVNKHSLAEQARRIGLNDLIKLGKTERLSEGQHKESILANCFEALLGALYLDGGLDAVEPLIDRCFGEALADRSVPRDPKTAFQEWVHAELRITPHYQTLSDSGIENDEERFGVEVVVGDEPWGQGVGRTKRAAETAAAAAGLVRAGKSK